MEEKHTVALHISAMIQTKYENLIKYKKKNVDIIKNICYTDKNILSWDIAKSVRHRTLTPAFRRFESGCPSHDEWSKKMQPRKQEKNGDIERFLRFFRL